MAIPDVPAVYHHHRLPETIIPQPGEDQQARLAESASPDSDQRHTVYICTKEGTPEELFEVWIRALPDRGRGFKKHWHSLGWQTYLTRLTYQQLAAVKEVEWVRFATVQPFDALVQLPS